MHTIVNFHYVHPPHCYVTTMLLCNCDGLLQLYSIMVVLNVTAKS